VAGLHRVARREPRAERASARRVGRTSGGETVTSTDACSPAAWCHRQRIAAARALFASRIAVAHPASHDERVIRDIESRPVAPRRRRGRPGCACAAAPLVGAAGRGVRHHV